MAKKISFIGRDDELALIEKLIEAWGSRSVLFIQGEGGVGKTRLLQEISTRFRENQYTTRLRGLQEIVDFDDPAFQVAENFNYKIAQMLGPTAFEPYNRRLMDWQALEATNVSREKLNREREKVYQTFVDCFNEVSSSQRVVLLIDTTDSLEGTETWKRIISMIDKLENVLLLLAGRNAKILYAAQEPILGADAQLIELKPLKIRDTEEYLKQKQDQLSVSFESNLTQRLLLLVGGRPILIDLATEWLSRNAPKEWLIKGSVEELQGLSDEEIQKRRKEFEVHLVLNICDTRTPMDRLILALSRIYPIDVDGIVKLLDISTDRAEKLFKQAQSHVFVKIIPGEKISLHDEMRRMINEYVWPEVDPDDDRQRHDSELAISYLGQKIQALEAQIMQLRQEEVEARQSKNVQSELYAFMMREGCERELWVLKEQQLFHTLFVNLDPGLNLFKENFDKDKHQQPYFLPFKRRLINQVQKYRDRLSAEQNYELDSRRVRYFADHGEYLEAKELATAILEERGVLPVYQAEMLIQRGNMEIRLGSLENGIKDFEDAVKICREQNLPKSWLLRGLNARGWAYRMRGNHDLALTDYSEAYEYSLELNDFGQMASILNNIGFVYSLKGNEKAALKNCFDALDLRKGLNETMEIGKTYCTLGEVFWRFNKPADALKYYSDAWEIFTGDKNYNIEWQSNVRTGRATVFMAQGKLDEAEQELNWSLNNGPASLKPRIYYYQGLIYWRRNQLEEAHQWLLESHNASIEFGDGYNEYKSFVDLLGLAWEFGEYDRWPELKAKFESLYRNRDGEENLRLRGSALRKLGDLAICNGNALAAQTFYEEALPLIAKYEVHDNYTINEQIKEIDRRLRTSTTPEVISKLGQSLTEIWRRDPELMRGFLNVLLTFKKWQQEGDPV